MVSFGSRNRTFIAKLLVSIGIPQPIDNIALPPQQAPPPKVASTFVTLVPVIILLAPLVRIVFAIVRIFEGNKKSSPVEKTASPCVGELLKIPLFDNTIATFFSPI